MIILGIETSCDETGVSIVKTESNSLLILSNVVASSMELHSKTGGIIPEIAAREQIKYILPVLDEALKQASITKEKVDAIAVTVGPGLIGSLLVGVETARTLSYVWDKPLIPVNHLFGHMYANFLQEDEQVKNIEFPAISLIVSGGHTDLVFMENKTSVKWIAGTRDDAAGEAYDKIGRLLGLSYPAGPVIERLAKSGNSKAYNFPRPLLHEPTFDFSFSGLKTAVLRETEKIRLNDKTIQDLARATQDAIIEVLVEKTMRAIFHYDAKSLLLSGGVAANQTLRDHFIDSCKKQDVNFYVPSRKLCTDNGAMIAAAGVFTKERVGWQDITANPELYFD